MVKEKEEFSDHQREEARSVEEKEKRWGSHHQNKMIPNLL